MKKLLFFIGTLTASVLVFSVGTSLADDLDCFDGSCGGGKGIPKCPVGSEELFWITYANNDANLNEDCTTVVSCTNFDEKKDVAVDCRFYHGFNGILAGGGPQDALCDTGLLTLGPGDSGQCATEIDNTRQGASELSGKIFTTTGGSASCPAFEGKGLVCASGDGDRKKIVCEAFLSCRGGAVLVDINVIPYPFDNDDDD